MWIRPLCVKNINRKLARNTQYVFVYIHSKRLYLMTKKESKSFTFKKLKEKSRKIGTAYDKTKNKHG